MKKKLRIKECYSYVMHGDVISAGAKFAGNWVWGHAHRHPADEYDETFGKNLAAARCNEKIAELRWRRARKKYDDARRAGVEADRIFEGACDYLANAYDLRKSARLRVSSLLEASAAEYVGECPHDCS